ncbi:phage integrase N-terminal SAM-like domain-containing protein [Pseudomaricurvus sp.]|uniref:phage integrase N-terminal SAM-like domain-containing protein n=1 Tax=Pseudomaricurvus sp. TaxID=2004510 RepID=UPI003F6C4FFB
MLLILHYLPINTRTKRAIQPAIIHWIIAFIRYHRYQHPQTLGEQHIRQFLVHLAIFTLDEVKRLFNHLNDAAQGG